MIGQEICIFDVDKTQTREVIYESNELVQANYNLGLFEQKVIHFVFSLIKKDDTDFKYIKFHVSNLNKDL
jgi:hypothetical protein